MKVLTEYLKKIEELVYNKEVLLCGCAEFGNVDKDENKKQRNEDAFWFFRKLSAWAKVIYGVDSDLNSVQQMKSQNFPIFCVDVEKMNLEMKFDVIITKQVFNHLSNPGLFLNSIEKHLRKDGVLIIITPNALCLNLFLLNFFNKMHTSDFVNPHHVALYDSYTLRSMLEKNNYQVKEFYYSATSFIGKFGSFFKKSFADDLFIIAEIR